MASTRDPTVQPPLGARKTPYSNLISAGTRETIRWLVEHRKIDCLVTTGGGIEEDIMKCLAPHYLGSQRGVEGFALKGAELRQKGINRIGNLLVPNRNYCLFEDWWVVVDAGHVHPCLPTPLGENRTFLHRILALALARWLVCTALYHALRTALYHTLAPP